MVDQSLLEFLKTKYDKDIYPKIITEEILQHPSKVDDIITGLISGNKKIRASCAEIASIVSEENPGIFYPHVDVFIHNLNSNIPKLRCYATYTIGNLAEVDESGKIKKQIKLLAQNLATNSNTLQNYSARALGRIARAQPKEAERIFNLLISHNKYFPKNKINIILDNLEYFSENKDLREDARRFIESYTYCQSKIVRSKAQNVLRKFSRSA
ncbi:MAG: hypothetical protein JSV49_07540 [Thermoplasmata archaeon]|nr:MAG: hypothetical protein JSV49_07540 [Thermoplasmata archaeon]